MLELSEIMGMSFSVCIKFLTSSRECPSIPPGCSSLKSACLKFFLIINAIARPSPKASIIVVEVVGAKLSLQASDILGNRHVKLEFFDKKLFLLQVMEIIFMFLLFA